MSDYQAIYDAVRSRIGYFDGQSLTQEIANRFDISFQVDMIKNEAISVCYEQLRPSVLFKPELILVDRIWQAKYGTFTGFGDSPEKAMRDFDTNWNSDEL